MEINQDPYIPHAFKCVSCCCHYCWCSLLLVVLLLFTLRWWRHCFCCFLQDWTAANADITPVLPRDVCNDRCDQRMAARAFGGVGKWIKPKKPCLQWSGRNLVGCYTWMFGLTLTSDRTVCVHVHHRLCDSPNSVTRSRAVHVNISRCNEWTTKSHSELLLRSVFDTLAQKRTRCFIESRLCSHSWCSHHRVFHISFTHTCTPSFSVIIC